jgi:diketogulonate reductase-like aldo/keto reductase
MCQSVVPKSTNEARIKENFNIFDWSIPKDFMSKLSEIPQACPNTYVFLHTNVPA